MNTMHLHPSVALRPNLELKTRPKQLLVSLSLVIALPDSTHIRKIVSSNPALDTREEMAGKVAFIRRSIGLHQSLPLLPVFHGRSYHSSTSFGRQTFDRQTFGRHIIKRHMPANRWLCRRFKKNVSIK